MASTSVLQNLGKKAKDYVAGLKALPVGESDIQGLKEAAQNVSTPAAAAPATAPVHVPTAAEKNNPLTRYGSRPEEKRIDVSDMVKSLPSYGEGGYVPEDQVAVVHEGEKVLTPEEAEKYTESSNKFVAPPKEKGSQSEAQPMRSEVTDQAITEAGMKESGTHPSQQAQPAPEQKGTDAERRAIEVDKQQAMGSGNLVKLGTATLNEKHLSAPSGMNQGTQGEGKGLEQGATPPADFAPKAGFKPMNVEPTAPAAAPTATPAAAPTATPAAAPTATPAAMDRKAKIADYDAKIQAALDTATPEGKELADRLSYAKQSFEHKNHWGTADNHPGFLGKLGHVAEEVGSRLPIAGPIMSNIPGTEGYNNRQAESTLGQINKDTPLTTARMTEESKESPKAGTPEQQLIPAEAELRAAQATGDPVKIKAAQDKVNDITTAAQAGKVPTEHEGTPEQQLITANENLRKATASGDPTAIATAKAKVDDITSAINSKTSATSTPATPEQIKEYGDRVATLGLTPEQSKVYGTAPAGTSAAELDKRYTEAQGLKNITDKEAEKKLQEQQHKDDEAHKANEQAGKIYDKYSTELDKIKTPADATAARANLAIHNLDLKTKEADAVVAPEILTLAAGGQGSGLRMNEAEIKRIAGGRALWDTLVAKANYIKENGGTFDDKQRGELRQIAAYIAERSAAVSSVLDQARNNMLAGADDEKSVRKAYNDGNRIASAIQRQGIVPEGGVRSPGDYVFFNGQVMIVDEKGKGHPVLTQQHKP